MNSPPRRKSYLILAIFSGGGLALFVVLLATFWMRSGPRLDTITDASAAQFREKWVQCKPDDYNLTIHVTTDEESVYKIHVRKGEPEAMWINDQLFTDQRPMEAWTIDGLFDLIDLDLESNSQRASGNERASRSPLILRGKFDEQWGFPQHYHRIDRDSRHEVIWEIITWNPDP